MARITHIGLEKYKGDITDLGFNGLYKDSDKTNLFVLYEKKDIAGVLNYDIVNDDIVFFKYLEVFPDFQGKGYAKKLMETFLNMYKDKDIYCSPFSTEGKKRLKPFLDSYKKNGFKIFYKDPPKEGEKN